MFGHAIFYNDGKGHFEMEPLPNTTQVSNLNDLVVMDGTDGKLLLGAGNMYQAEVETPRNDASIGFLLNVAEKGTLKSIDSKYSGIQLPYQVNALAKIKIQDTLYIVVASNNSTVRLLRLNPNGEDWVNPGR